MNSVTVVPPIMKLPRLSGVVYDLEIINAVPDKKRTREKGINYCYGWEDYKGMGIACVCAYDLWEREIRVFTKGNFDEMMKLFEAREEVIGYYSSGFDDKVLQAAGFKIRTTYDICRNLKDACGEPEKYIRGKSSGGFSLGQIAQDNGMADKREDGWKAPMMWQLGQYGRVIDYCIDDVMKTFKLFQKREGLFVGSYARTVKLRDPKVLRDYQEAQLAAQREAYRAARNVKREDMLNEQAATGLGVPMPTLAEIVENSPKKVENFQMPEKLPEW